MSADPFAALDAELARWQGARQRVPLWWRDDDATAPSPALDAALDRAGRWGLPLGLAAIPAGATPALAARVRDAPVAVMVHGWAHANHEPAGVKKSEFGRARGPRAAAADAARGLARIRDLFGDRAVPVFVPPWNRIAPGHAARLPVLGFRALSAVPGAGGGPHPGLVRLDTEIDPIDWRSTRSLADPAVLCARIAALLAARRAAPRPAPLGLLTHHLAHDRLIWEFLDTLVPKLLYDACNATAVPDLMSGETAP